jgi:hypothetical protein
MLKKASASGGALTLPREKGESMATIEVDTVTIVDLSQKSLGHRAVLSELFPDVIPPMTFKMGDKFRQSGGDTYILALVRAAENLDYQLINIRTGGRYSNNVVTKTPANNFGISLIDLAWLLEMELSSGELVNLVNSWTKGPDW